MVKRETKNTLQTPAHPHVLRIVELRASGVVILEGSDAARCTKQMKDVAHCPLPILDTTLHPGRYWRGASKKCQQCGLPNVLGPLSLVTSVPIASTPNPHLCASSLVSVVSLESRFCFVF